MSIVATIPGVIPFIHNGRVIEGIQFTGDNYKEVRDFIGNTRLMDIITIRINTNNKEYKEYYPIYGSSPLSYKDYTENEDFIIGFKDTASGKEINSGDWIFKNRGKYYYKPASKVTSNNFIPLYKRTPDMDSIELPVFEGSNVEYLQNKDSGKVYKAIRYTGKNINEIKNHIKKYSNSINTPPSNTPPSIYGYIPDFRFNVFDCSIEKDVYNPIVVIILSTPLYGKSLDEDTVYMYPGDYIILGLDEFCCETYSEKLYNRLKKRYKVVTKSNGIRLFVVKEDAEFIDQLINFFSNLKKIDYDEYKYDKEISVKDATEIKEYLYRTIYNHSGEDCKIRTFLRGEEE